jgi:L-fucose isomerase-like protein
MAIEVIKPKVGVSAVCSPLEAGADRAPGACEELSRALRDAGCEVVSLRPIGSADDAADAGRRLCEAHVDAVAVASVSWFEDYLLLDLIEECPAPLLLWSLPGMETGALCGTQQLTWYLRRLEHPFHCLFGAMGQPRLIDDAMAFLRGASLARRLRRARIGLGGCRVAGMTETSVNEVAMKRSVGPRIVMLDLPQLLKSAGQMPQAAAESQWKAVVARAGSCGVSQVAGVDAMRFCAAVREQIDRHRLSALAIGCYPHLMGVPCLAASLLADDGIPLGCEGDANGAVAQLMLTWLSGQPTHNTDWLDPMSDGSVVFTHCGSGSLSLAQRKEDVSLQSVRLMGQGVCALFPARPGPVTLLNLTASGDGYQCALLQGQAIPTTMVFPGNPLRVRFDQPTPRIMQWIHDEGLGHHWMAGYGHFAGEMRHWARIVGKGLRLVECPA